MCVVPQVWTSLLNAWLLTSLYIVCLERMMICSNHCFICPTDLYAASLILVPGHIWDVLRALCTVCSFLYVAVFTVLFSVVGRKLKVFYLIFARSQFTAGTSYGFDRKDSCTLWSSQTLSCSLDATQYCNLFCNDRCSYDDSRYRYAFDISLNNSNWSIMNYGHTETDRQTNQIWTTLGRRV